MSKTVRYINAGDTPVHLEIGCRPGTPPLVYDVAPGETVDLPAGYCQPGAHGRASWVQRRAPGLKRVQIGERPPAKEEKKPDVEVKKTAEKKAEKPAKKQKKWSETTESRKAKKD